MTRYYFNINDCGTVIADDEGAVLPTLEAARDYAIDAARSIMCADLAEGRLCLGCNIEVLDDAGRTAVTMPFKEAVEIIGG